ncbi:unnamed protein product [Cuscuta campestris]|uniref:Senescence regulator S40 n=1 Tax=Cuscuta campestris TaxID=132261 RepID=A0A484M385_9ASTE|nr:unnamed protein product [Cuscuta campestris]
MSMVQRRNGLYSKGSSGWTSIRSEDLQEGDVWELFPEREKFTPKANKEYPTALRLIPTAAKMIPRSTKNPSSHDPKIIPHSAPVIIQDWSKIHSAGSNKAPCSPAFLGDAYDHHGQEMQGDGFVRRSRDGGDDKEEEEDDGGEEDVGPIVPPHEWIARKLARRQISSFSVCEGVGRTLKGRDLSRVRNAVLSKTGFLE